MKKNFSSIFKEARYKSGLTNLELADKLDLSSAYISKIEVGRDVPAPDILKKICKFFNLDLNDMINLIIKTKVEEYKKTLEDKYNL